MSHLSVWFVTLVIQSGAMAKFWPLHHYSQCMGENRRNTLSTTLHISWERGRVNPILSTIIFLFILLNMSHLSVWFVTLVIQSGAMAKFWPLHHYSQCMGEKGRNTLSTALHISWERGRVNPIFSTIIAKDAS